VGHLELLRRVVVKARVYHVLVFKFGAVGGELGFGVLGLEG
jgi:hypothetical protein